MSFKQAVENTPELTGRWCAGLQALLARDHQYVAAADGQRLRGSVNLDAALRAGNEPVWDYALGHQPSNRKNGQEVVYWLEVHPATDGEVKVVLKKLDWLIDWLRNRAPLLRKLPAAYVWVSSGKTAFTARSPQAKLLAQRRLQHHGRQLRIPDEFV